MLVMLLRLRTLKTEKSFPSIRHEGQDAAGTNGEIPTVRGDTLRMTDAPCSTSLSCFMKKSTICNDLQ